MKLGICLAGGGIKGVAHIGAIKAMEEENIKFDCFAGTSSGSIVAALLACGYNSNEIYEFFKKYAKNVKYIDWKNVLKIVYGVIFKRKLIVNGLNSGEIIEKIMKKACDLKGIHNISDLDKELLIPAVDAESGKVFVFNSCNIRKETEEEKFISEASLPKVVRASCSYPVVFSPCDFKQNQLLDGGIKENIPWRELKSIKCDRILSINFKSKYKKKCCNNAIEVAERSLELINDELYRYEVNNIDFLHSIELNNVTLLEIEKMEEIYEQGYIQTKRKLQEIKYYLA